MIAGLALSCCAASAQVASELAAGPCAAAIATAERAADLPPGLLPAIARVESGRYDPDSGTTQPWPWTIDAGGIGRFFATEAEAITAVRALQAEGVRSIDVGCLQVNLAQHPDAFASLEDAFDPAANAAYAARFLRALYAETGGWPAVAAAYHSRTPALAQPYRALVMAAWEGVDRLPDGGLAAPLLPAGPMPKLRPFAPPPLGAAPTPPSEIARLMEGTPVCAPAARQPSPWTPPAASSCPGSPFASTARLLHVLAVPRQPHSTRFHNGAVFAGALGGGSATSLPAR
jgi:hypothetical protein